VGWPMTTISVSDRREADAAFFEDWSAWASLDGKPIRPVDQPLTHRDREDYRWRRYYCSLLLRCPRCDGPGFEICIPSQASIHRIIERMPGIRRDPRATAAATNVAWSGLLNVYYLPAQHWRDLLARLPEVKRLTTAYAERQPPPIKLS
jgi:hypothetical protein